MNNINITIFNSDVISLDLLNFISLLAVFFGIYVIISNNPVLSVLFLIGLFFCISIYLILLGLHFIGLSYLLVYVGAISMLFLFILMLINIRVSELFTDNRNSLLLAVLTVFCFNFSISDSLPQDTYSYSLYNNFIITYIIDMSNNLLSFQFVANARDYSASLYEHLLSSNIFDVADISWDSLIVTATQITSLGNVLYTNLYALILIMSIILLLAMVGAITITINNKSSKNVFSSPDLPKYTTTRLQSTLQDFTAEMAPLLRVVETDPVQYSRIADHCFSINRDMFYDALHDEYHVISKELFRSINAFVNKYNLWNNILRENNLKVVHLGEPGELQGMQISRYGHPLRGGDASIIIRRRADGNHISKDLFETVWDKGRDVQARFDEIHDMIPTHDREFMDLTSAKKMMNHPEREIQMISKRHLSKSFSGRASFYSIALDILGPHSNYPIVFPKGTH